TAPLSRGVTVESAYGYSPGGELVETLDRSRGRTEFRYDPVGQLLASLPEQAKAEVFRYDPRGNLYEAAPGDPSRRYSKGNRLLQKGATTYRWDGDGRLTEKRTATEAGDEVWSYRWNAAGLAEVTRPDQHRVRFTYDPSPAASPNSSSRPSPAPASPPSPPPASSGTASAWLTRPAKPRL